MRIVVVASKRMDGKKDEGLAYEKYHQRGTDRCPIIGNGKILGRAYMVVQHTRQDQ